MVVGFVSNVVSLMQSLLNNPVMLFNVEINGRKITARRDETILSLLNRSGLHVPTLCYMSGFTPSGACRMCVVEIEGLNDLVPACSHLVEEWMKIHTHSQRVISARRTLVELLLANHPDDCLYCSKSGICELQRLADELNVTERKFRCKKRSILIDRNCPSIERNPAKCILCGRCIRVCDEIIGVSAIDFIGRGSNSSVGTIQNKGVNDQACVKCGQCIMVCPTDALKEKPSVQKVMDALNDKNLHCVIQFSPTVPGAIAEEFGLKSGKDILNLLKTAIIGIGFKQVFDTTFGADVAIINVASEFISRWKKKEKLPMFTSCCPSWMKYIEEFYPDFLGNIASSKSPQMIMGSLIKSDYGPRRSIPSKNIFSVSVMPCTAKKYEAEKNRSPEHLENDLTGIDAVLTTREFIKLIKLFGINFNSLEQEPIETYFGIQSSAGRLFGTSGGALEGIIRTIYFNMTGQEFPGYKIMEIRGFKSRKEVRIKIGKNIFGFAAVSGLANAKILLDEIRNGREDLQLVEIMACPNGCINGGGQRFGSDEKIMKNRMKNLYDADEEDMIRAAHKNPLLANHYDQSFSHSVSKKPI
jgi:iron-only hydrogenase group A